VRRFFIINIITTAVYVTTDLHYAGAALHIFLILRFGVLVPMLIASLYFGSIYKQTTQWRLGITTLMMLVHGAVALYMAIYASYIPLANNNEVYDFYSSVCVRTIIFGFSGTGLRWIYSTVTGMILMLAFLVSGILILISPSVVMVFVLMVGIPLTYSEERIRRLKFALIFYEQEVLEYIRGSREAQAVHNAGS